MSLPIELGALIERLDAACQAYDLEEWEFTWGQITGMLMRYGYRVGPRRKCCAADGWLRTLADKAAEAEKIFGCYVTEAMARGWDIFHLLYPPD